MSQPSLKPQDVIVAVKIALLGEVPFTYAAMGNDLGLAPSQVHASVRALSGARLAVGATREGVVINRARLLELVLFGVPIVFYPVVGAPARGVPTAFALKEIKDQFSSTDSYVWPSAAGKAQGISLAPLHPCAVQASNNDRQLYNVLMAIDAIRVGGARERDIAATAIRTQLR